MRNRCIVVAIAGLIAGAGLAPAAIADPDIGSSAAMDILMITQDEAARVMGVGLPNAYRYQDGSLPQLESDRPDCGSVLLGSGTSYGGAGYDAVHAQMFWDRASWTNLVQQSVAVFGNDDAAADFVAREANRWRRCENQTAEVTEHGADGTTFTSSYAIDGIGQTANTVSVELGMTVGGVHTTCQHVLANGHNAAVEIRTCSSSSPGQGRRAGELLQIALSRVPAR